MSVTRPASRHLRLCLSTSIQSSRRTLSSSCARLDAPETTPAATRTAPRRALDVNEIFKAQQGSGPGEGASFGLKGEGKSRLALQYAAPRYEVVETCPDPECACAEMPRWLPIDKTSKMSMPYYDRHVLTTSTLPAGQQDHSEALRWPSKIESDPNDLLTLLKNHLGPKGQSYRPDFSVSVTASTLPASEPGVEDVWLFPDFVRLRVRRSSKSLAAAEASSSSSSTKGSGPDAAFFSSAPDESGMLAKLAIDDTPVQLQALRSNSSQGMLANMTRITKPVVLICGHGKRDPRCRDLGPLLLKEFEKHLVDPLNGSSSQIAAATTATTTSTSPLPAAHLALVSHIGGHKFAGNVVIYMPPNELQAPQFSGHYAADDPVGNLQGSSDQVKSDPSPIDGTGIWYGRVEPRHVEGIVKETIRGGKVIGELLRGVHDFGGAIWR